MTQLLRPQSIKIRIQAPVVSSTESEEMVIETNDDDIIKIEPVDDISN